MKMIDEGYIIGGEKVYPRKKAGKITSYTTEEIVQLRKQGKSDDYILNHYVITSESLHAIDANITMGTYKRGRNRDLDDKETEGIYRLLAKNVGTEEIAKKFNTTRIRIMGFKASFTKKKNLEQRIK